MKWIKLQNYKTVRKIARKPEYMESIKIINDQGVKLQVIYQRQGNDKYGNPLYIINILRDNINVNWK